MITSFKIFDPMLLDTVKSVLNQNSIRPDELEYIIWSGGSKDLQLEKLLEPFGGKVRLVYGQDLGLYDSLGQVFPSVSGDIVSYLNVGDLWSANTVRFVLDVFRDDPKKQWVCGLQTVYNRQGMIVSTRLPFKFRRKFIRSGLYGRQRFLPVIQQESTFWRRDLLKLLDLEFFRGLKRAGDAYMWMKFAEREDLYVCKVVLGGYREHDNHLAGGYEQYQLERNLFQEGFRLRWLPMLIFDKFLWRAIDERKISMSGDMIAKV